MIKKAHVAMILAAALALVLSTGHAAAFASVPGIAQQAEQANGDPDPADLTERAADAAATLGEILNAPDEGVPSWLLEKAQCIAVVPKVVKVGFVVGARHGRGLLSCKIDGSWSRPSFVSLTGGSFGLQIGAEATDFVLVFGGTAPAQDLFGDKFVIGGDASVSAGPVGRTAEAATDIRLDHEIFSYSRSKGVFAGVSVEGAEFGIDEEANEEIYGSEVTAQQLLTVKAKSPAAVAVFTDKLTELVPATGYGRH